MKIRKVDDKPMVIHTKRKPRLHTGKKAVTGKKAENTSAAVKGRKPHIGIRDKYTESGRSVKVRNQSLKTMAAACRGTHKPLVVCQARTGDGRDGIF